MSHRASTSYHVHESYEGDEELLLSVRTSDSDQNAAELDKEDLMTANMAVVIIS